MAVNEEILLNQKEVFPSEEVPEEKLGSVLFSVYKDISDILKHEYSLTLHWKYYSDGKSWLCKVVHKKKTICWLSVWTDHIKLSFYFTEKTRAGIEKLKIRRTVKSDFLNIDLVGKLIPLILKIRSPKYLNEIRQIVNYKISVC